MSVLRRVARFILFPLLWNPETESFSQFMFEDEDMRDPGDVVDCGEKFYLKVLVLTVALTVVVVASAFLLNRGLEH